MTPRSTAIPPQIHYLRASAGAGKTYQLTIRFISLLAHVKPSAEALRQIVAVTFTNRAAAEMKERIILTLKQMALGAVEAERLSHETGLQPPDAVTWLDTILAHFSDFHVRTIDSLVYALLKAFSLEMGMRPDLEVTFDYNTMLNQCFDRFLSRIEWVADDQRYRLLTDLLETYLNIEEAEGMVVERGIRRKLLELYEKTDGVPAVGHQPDVDRAQEALCQAVQNLNRGLVECGVLEYLNKRFYKPSYLDDPVAHIDKSFFAKTTIQEMLTSKAQGIAPGVIAHVEELYSELLKSKDQYLELRALAKVHAYMKALEALYQEIQVLSEREGLILGGGWHALVKGYLKEGPITGLYAFMKLGSVIRHFLIDEFQDTSRPQWEALLPLLEESLASGGSLFYVGDVKQAIYAWRGGDWHLFGEVAEDFFPSVSMKDRKGETLTMNYRSLPVIVDFNNRLYRILADEQFAQQIAALILGEKAQRWAQNRLAELIRRNFKDVGQETAPHLQRSRERGMVTVASFTASGDELRQAVRERLVTELKEVWERRGKGVAVLVRRNQDAEDIAAWLMIEGIPVVTENSLRLRSSDLIKGFVAFLRFLDYPLDDLAFWGAASSRLLYGFHGISSEVLEDFFAEGGWQPPLYKSFERRFPTFFAELIHPLLARVGFVTPYDLAREVVERFQLLRRFPEEEVFIHRFFELIFQTEAQGQRSLSHFLQFWEEKGFEEKIGLPDEISAVRVITIHKAKGLEFPAVFIPFTNWRLERPRLAMRDDGSFVNLKRPLPFHLESKRTEMIIDDALETLNLLYVATTRAEEELYLYETTIPLFRGGGVDRSYLSAWLREMLLYQRRSME